MIKNNETEKLTPSEKTIIEKLISLLQELSFLINIYDTFAIPNGNKTFWIARINKPILIFPEINYQLPTGDYFIEKNNFQINIPTSITNETFRVAPIIFQNESKTYEEPFNLFTLIPRLKEDYNKHLLKPETIEKIEEIEKLLLKEKNKKELIQKVTNNFSEKSIHPYNSIPSSALTKTIKQFLNSPNRLESSKKGRIEKKTHYLTQNTIITYTSKDCTFTLTVARTKEIFTKKVKNGAKVFNFLLQKLNEQHYEEETNFLLKELIDSGIYSSKDSAYRGLKSILNKMKAINIKGIVTKYDEGKKKEIRNIEASLIGQRDVSYNRCFVYLPPIIRNYAPFITILPRWSYSLGENAYMLLDYIFYMARQKNRKIQQQKYFTLSLENIRKHMGIISPQETEHHQQLIVEPIENAIVEIEDAREETDIKITPVYKYDYKNIQEYLKGYLKIELDEKANQYMNKIATQKNRKIKAIVKKSQTNNNKVTDS